MGDSLENRVILKEFCRRLAARDENKEMMGRAGPSCSGSSVVWTSRWLGLCDIIHGEWPTSSTLRSSRSGRRKATDRYKQMRGMTFLYLYTPWKIPQAGIRVLIRKAHQSAEPKEKEKKGCYSHYLNIARCTGAESRGQACSWSTFPL